MVNPELLAAVTSLQIDEKLLQEALAVSTRVTVSLVIEEALREYIQRRQQLKIVELFGTIEYEEDYDYKRYRQAI